MRYFSLSGIAQRLSVVCLGTAEHGSRFSEGESFALLDDFAAHGGTFLDTAHVYADWLPNGHGASERTVGRWLRSREMTSTVAVGTKGGHPRLETMHIPRLRPEDIAQDIAESLERLGAAHIALYWLHRDDPAVPVGEILSALDVHLQDGEIGAIGASNWRTDRLWEASEYAFEHGLIDFCASQISWSLRESPVAYNPETGMVLMNDRALEFSRRSGMHIIPYSAQAGGFFARPCPAGTSALNRRRWERAQTLAARHRTTPNAVALAYLLNHPCSGAAVAGPHTTAQMADTCAAADLPLTSDELLFLEASE